MSRLVLALVALGALTACETPTANSPHARAPLSASLSSAPTNQQAVVAQQFTIANACNGDVVDVSGKMHISITTDPSGAMSIHENGADLTGTAADGTVYNFIRVSRADITTSPFDEVFTAEYRVISRGAVPNFLLDMTAHLYQDASGFHVVIESMSAKCVG